MIDILPLLLSKYGVMAIKPLRPKLTGLQAIGVDIFVSFKSKSHIYTYIFYNE